MSTDTFTPKEALRRAAALVGGQAAVARLLGYEDRRSVSPWFNTDRDFPAEHCPVIERATNGAVRCEDLRPDVAWEVLREQAEPAQQQEASNG